MPNLPRPDPAEYCCGLEPEYTPLLPGTLYLIRCTYKGRHLYVGTLTNGTWSITPESDLPYSQAWEGRWPRPWDEATVDQPAKIEGGTE